MDYGLIMHIKQIKRFLTWAAGLHGKDPNVNMTCLKGITSGDKYTYFKLLMMGFKP